nr:AzlC family ABC transporter permease [Actinoalloteichus caeruleus]
MSPWTRRRGPVLEPEARRDIAAMAVAVGVVGLSFGAIAVASGLSIWLAVLMSLLVFAGGSQFMAVGVVAAGALRWPRSPPGSSSTPATCPSAWPSATSSGADSPRSWSAAT